MRDFFARDPQRFEQFLVRLGDILFDYSKNRITEETMSLLSIWAPPERTWLARSQPCSSAQRST